jgi:hypothetical protein
MPSAAVATGSGLSFPRASSTILWAHALPAAALAGMLAGFAMMLTGLFGVWMTVAGFLSVVFYRRRTRGEVLVPGAGARMGAVSGLLGFSLFALVTVPTGLFRAMLLEMIQRYVAQRPDAQFQAMADLWLESLKSPHGLAIWLILLFVFLAVAAAVGGALGSVVLRRGIRR